jgi:hypothetical protein
MPQVPVDARAETWGRLEPAVARPVGLGDLPNRRRQSVISVFS